jgi:hypothetical protein
MTARERLAAVEKAVSAAAAEAGRTRGDITLIAVSKTFPAASIEPVIEAGQVHFGENRIQEAAGKWPDLKARFPGLILHLIGPMQSNKVRDAVGLFDVIHTIDRPKIARLVAQEMARTGRTPQLFVQVNTGAEAQKAGVAPEETAAFLDRCRGEFGLDISGLMCIPPADEEAALHFALLAKLGREAGLGLLSMGMSADYEKAIAYGATHIRVGSAIFGVRG